MIFRFQREKSRKYSQSWQRQHAADELKTVSEHGISTLDVIFLFGLDHRSNAERGIDELPTVHMGVAACQMEKKGIATEKGELNRNKRDKYEEAHRAELTLWNAASRYLHANLPKGTKPPLPISEWEKEYATLSGQRTAEYTKLKETRAEVAELHNIRKCV